MNDARDPYAVAGKAHRAALYLSHGMSAPRRFVLSTLLAETCGYSKLVDDRLTIGQLASIIHAGRATRRQRERIREHLHALDAAGIVRATPRPGSRYWLVEVPARDLDDEMRERGREDTDRPSPTGGAGCRTDLHLRGVQVENRPTPTGGAGSVDRPTPVPVPTYTGSCSDLHPRGVYDREGDREGDRGGDRGGREALGTKSADGLTTTADEIATLVEMRCTRELPAGEAVGFAEQLVADTRPEHLETIVDWLTSTRATYAFPSHLRAAIARAHPDAFARTSTTTTSTTTNQATTVPAEQSAIVRQLTRPPIDRSDERDTA